MAGIINAPDHSLGPVLATTTKNPTSLSWHSTLVAVQGGPAPMPNRSNLPGELVPTSHMFNGSRLGTDIPP